MTAAMNHQFSTIHNTTAGRSGVRVQQIYDLLVESGDNMSIKEMGDALGVDVKIREHQKDLSNRCGYLVQHGHIHRIAPGIYKAGPAPQRGSAMTMTDIPTPRLAPVPGDAGPVAAPAEPVDVPEGAHLGDDGKLRCDVCDKPVASRMGLMNHMTRSHGKGKRLTPDECFERSGEALEVLFPDGIPMSRLIEIAELQKQMVRAIR